MDWRRLETDEAFQLLYDRSSGAIGRELAALEAKIFDPLNHDPQALAHFKGLRLGLLRVQECVSELARVEAEARKTEILGAAVPRPADVPYPKVF